ncbi:MAG: precorrin-6y C5,15-methyltransferase (decarboxylating) subunit CbiE, partial [Fusobacteriaceae bacterium]
MRRINIVGAGPGDIAFLTEAGRDAIKNADLLIGDTRLLKSVETLIEKQEIYGLKKFSELLQILNLRDGEITIVVSGDTGFYSLLDYLKRNLGDTDLEVIPGITSFQYLFAKLKKCWHNYLLVSLHGRESDFVKLLELSQSGVILLTDTENTPYTIGKKLTE